LNKQLKFSQGSGGKTPSIQALYFSIKAYVPRTSIVNLLNTQPSIQSFFLNYLNIYI
jgi:hypothetical protein